MTDQDLADKAAEKRFSEAWQKIYAMFLKKEKSGGNVYVTLNMDELMEFLRSEYASIIRASALDARLVETILASVCDLEIEFIGVMLDLTRAGKLVSHEQASTHRNELKEAIRAALSETRADQIVSDAFPFPGKAACRQKAKEYAHIIRTHSPSSALVEAARAVVENLESEDVLDCLEAPDRRLITALRSALAAHEPRVCIATTTTVERGGIEEEQYVFACCGGTAEALCGGGHHWTNCPYCSLPISVSEGK